MTYDGEAGLKQGTPPAMELTSAAFHEIDCREEPSSNVKEEDLRDARVVVMDKPFPLLHRWVMCGVILLTRIAAHFDAGAFAALFGEEEERFERDMDLDSTQKALLITLGYVGLIIGCLLSGTLLQNFEARRLLQLSLLLLGCGLGGFCASPDFIAMAATRPVIGFGQALLTVLYPVWVDEFAPLGSASTYMAILQAGGPLGTVFGYLISAFMMSEAKDLSWRWVFAVQGGLLAPAALVYFIVPMHYIDLRPSQDEETIPLWKGLKTIVKTSLVWTATLTLSSLYFVVNGLQTYVTEYIVQGNTSVTTDETTVISTFGFTAATAPVAGIILGGTLLSKAGGYRGNIDKTSLMGLGLGFFACGFSYAALAMQSFAAFIACIWFVLFFGGGMVPGLMGIIVASVAKDTRGLVSAFAAVLYNTLGYALGPLAYGVVADAVGGADGKVWGFRVVLGWSGAALIMQGITVAIAYYKVYKVKNGYEAMSPASQDGSGGTSKRHTYGTLGTVLPETRLSLAFSVSPNEVKAFKTEFSRYSMGLAFARDEEEEPRDMDAYLGTSRRHTYDQSLLKKNRFAI